MDNSRLTFRARARTIEHLGKGQIADCPTAVSELWKNAYDAYARDVSLYTLDDHFPSGALVDNGCGMSLEQIIDNWLVVGTDSKSTKKTLDAASRFGLGVRKTQGEKGIGRLSAAFLSSVTFLVTKKTSTDFTAILVDWRLFENPYLSFDDVIVPSKTFQKLEQIESILPELIVELRNNVFFDDNDTSSASKKRAWMKFSEDEDRLNNKYEFITTQQKILEFCESFIFDMKLVSPWETILKKVEEMDGAQHGTAIFLLELGRELSLLTNRQDLSRDNIEIVDIEKELVDTLRAFVNPYIDVFDEFSYQIFTLRKNGYQRQILSQTDVFGRSDFDGLEHSVIGEVDSKGWFRGKVRAFGEDKGVIAIPPSIDINLTSNVGPFNIAIGTYEVKFYNTSHSEREHGNLDEKAKKYAGLMVFRDDLRVLPYGRVDNDFFLIEERRSLSAGRYFWSNRRLFGQINITQDENRELKDKSGREGFIRNQAARQLKSLVSDLLTELADKFFGGNSEDRKELLDNAKREKEQRKNAQSQARKSTQKSFINALKDQKPLLDNSLKELNKIKDSIDNGNVVEIDILRKIDLQLNRLESIRSEIKTPVKPAKIGLYEEKYREYRDKYNEFSVCLLQIKSEINKLDTQLNIISPIQILKKNLEKNQGIINARLNKYSNSISNKLDEMLKFWNSEMKDDRSAYYYRAIPILEEFEKEGSNLEECLNLLDSIYIEMIDTYIYKYQSVEKGLLRMLEGVNLESAFSISEEERLSLEEKTRSLNSLSQLGISVEILSHELEEMDALVTKGLNSLPFSVKNHPGYELAYNAHKSLTNQIRFLSPLKISGYQSRQKITGQNIYDHVTKFFGDRFDRQRVDFIVGEEFLKMSISDLPSRIFPVFLNLINNALYWVCLSSERTIKINLMEDLVIIANSGPKIDEDDIPRLFELFYSKRANGHGVGLYLCRENLAVAFHEIWYSNDIFLIENGANFIIKFKGLEK